MNKDYTSPRIEIRNLVKTYARQGGGTITPVDHVDLIVDQNELVVLLGPSGCGKTTLLRCVAGLERPDSGEIIVDGKTVFSSAKGIFEPANRRDLSMVFQSYALWPHMTVEQNVAYPLRSQKVSRTDIPKRVSEVLDMVGVGGLQKQYPGQISGGQQQRVALARALVASSSVILFDEPLSNVDAQVRAQLRFELQAMQRRLGFSSLYVTHDQTEAMELGHRVAVLDSGRISALGEPFEVYSNPPNEYVAKFVGVANIFRGKISSRSAERVVLDSEIGEVSVPVSGLMDASLGQGSAVSMVLRPETLRLTAERPADAVNAIEVSVDARLFSGAHTEVVVQAAGKPLTVWMSNYRAAMELPVNGKAWLVLEPEAVRVVPAGKAGANG